jgi:hypothetical protein
VFILNIENIHANIPGFSAKANSWYFTEQFQINREESNIRSILGPLGNSGSACS